MISPAEQRFRPSTAYDVMAGPVFHALDHWRRVFKTVAELNKEVEPLPWHTPHEVKLSTPIVELLDFGTLDGVSQDEEFPVYMDPPQAGHGSPVADFGPGQSLVEAALQQGAHVYAANWLPATQKTSGTTIDNLIETTHQLIEEIAPGDKKLTLVGLCQGGWQSAIYAAMYPEKIEHLVLAGAPIDFKAGDGKIQRYAEFFPMSFYESLVEFGGKNMPGEFMLFGFKMLNPFDRFVKDPMDVYRNIDDEKYIERSRHFRRWYESTQDIPGTWYKQAVEWLFKKNRLINGELEILGQRVDLSRITCPVTLVAGDKDDITLPEQVFNADHYVGTEDVEKVVVPGGHIGLFIGKEGINNPQYWPAIFKRSKVISLEEARQRKASQTVYEQDKELAGVA